MNRTPVSSTSRQSGARVLTFLRRIKPTCQGSLGRGADALRSLIPVVVTFSTAGLLFTGCSTSTRSNVAAAVPVVEPQTLRSGDVIKITFPRVPTLDTTQQIRRDGKINLHMVGEVNAADMSPAALESRLLELYASQLVSKEVRVTVVSSAFAVFVTGAVVHPGKLTPDRTLTAFEAIMEAGGFDLTKADTKSVTVIRQESGQTRNFTLNLKAVLDGKVTEPFYLKAYDVVFVPEKFSWF